MSIHLGLRALALLAFVAAATAVIVKPELIGLGSPAGHTLNPAFALGHF